MPKVLFRQSLLAVVAFFALGVSFFACKGAESGNLDKTKDGREKEYFTVTFSVDPSEQGSIVAMVGKEKIESGVTLIEKGKEVIFTLTIKDLKNYALESWKGAYQGIDPFTAKLEISGNAKVIAQLKKKNSGKQDGPFKVTYSLLPEVAGELTATFQDGTAIQSGVTLIDKGKEVIFHLKITDSSYEFDEWVGVDQEEDDHSTAKLKVSSNKTVKAKLKKKTDEENKKATVSAIEVANVDKDGMIEEYVPFADFKEENVGPYTTKDAVTAYITLRVKVEKKAKEGEDFSLLLENKTTYNLPEELMRGENKEQEYFLSGRSVLSKGMNVFELKVINPDKSVRNKYTVKVNYAGGPDMLTLPIDKRRVIAGIYCPTLRKPLEGEVHEALWIIGIAGYCGQCNRALNAAGNQGHILEKYKDQGLRAVAIDFYPGVYAGAEEKWRDAGASYPLYTLTYNCLWNYIGQPTGFPHCVCVKEDRKWFFHQPNPAQIRDYFGFHD